MGFSYGIIGAGQSGALFVSGAVSIFDATAVPGNDADLIGSWADLVGTNTLTATTTKPTLKRNIVNGKSVMRFSGSSTYILKVSPTGFPTAGSAFTSFWVFAITTGSQLRHPISWGPGLSSTATNTVKYRGDGFECAGNYVHTPGAFSIVCATYAGGAVNTNFKLYTNGVAETMTGNTNTTGNNAGEFRIGSGATATEPGFVGDIGLYAHYNRGLTTAEQRAIEADLSTRFGIPVT